MPKKSLAAKAKHMKLQADRIIHNLYDAALDPSAWQEFGKILCSAFDSTSFLLAVQSRAERRVDLFETNWSAEQIGAYLEHFYHIDCWMEQGLRQPAMIPMIGDYFVPDRDFVRTEIYHDFARPNDIRHMTGIWGVTGCGAQCTLGLHGSERRGPYEMDEAEQIERLFPHVLRSIRLSETLGAARRAGGICETALNALATGIVVVDTFGVVVLANRAAEAFAAAREGFALTSGSKDRAVAAALAEDTRRLRQIIARAAPLDAAVPQGGSMRLRSAMGSRGYALTVAPLPRAAQGLSRGKRALALMLITDPRKAARPAEQQLSELFGLTPAEARLVAYLSQGRTRTEYAETAGIAALTVKTHLANAFAKLGVHRESELVHLVLSVTLDQLAPG